MRYTFRDDPEGAIVLDLPQQSHTAAGIVFGLVAALFIAIGTGMFAGLRTLEVRDLFDLMMALFYAFWLIGWSVGTLIVSALAVLFLFARQSARIEGGRLVRVPRLGPLNFVCEYELAKMTNLRLEPVRDGKLARIRFDYAGGRSSIGDAVPPAAAQAAIERIRQAAPAAARLFEQAPEPAAAPASAQAPRPALPASVPLWSLSSLALLAANFLPLAGILLLGWNLGHVVVLYWAESAAIGFYTVLKIVRVSRAAAVFVVPYFVAHFGAFMAIHFLFVYGFFIHGFVKPLPRIGPYAELVQIFRPVAPALLALFISHGISFAVNFVGQREYEGASSTSLMHAPYRRIFIMHVTLIFGGWLVTLLGTPAPALALLVVIKTGVDLRAHRREHRRAMSATPQPQPASPDARSP